MVRSNSEHTTNTSIPILLTSLAQLILLVAVTTSVEYYVSKTSWIDGVSRILHNLGFFSFRFFSVEKNDI